MDCCWTKALAPSCPGARGANPIRKANNARKTSIATITARRTLSCMDAVSEPASRAVLLAETDTAGAFAARLVPGHEVRIYATSASSANEQAKPGQQRNCGETAPDDPRLLQIDLLRDRIITAAEVVEAAAPTPVSVVEGEGE